MIKIFSNDIELILIEIPFKTTDVDVSFSDKYNTSTLYYNDIDKDIMPYSFKNFDGKIELINTTAKLTELEAEKLVQCSMTGNNPKSYGHLFDESGYHSKYKDKFGMWSLYSALESFKDLLISNGIDTNKNYAILKY